MSFLSAGETLKSTVSPLPAVATSSSSDTASAKANAPERSDLGLSGRRSRSGEILLGPNEPIPGAMEAKSSKPSHRRSGSVPVLYSGGSFSSGSTGGSGSSSSTSSSPATNVMPAGNICPSGRIVKTGMMTRSNARTDVLGSGTGNYGHGSIVRGGAIASNRSGKPPETVAYNGVSSAVAKALSSMDPEEVKRVGNEHYRRGQFAEALKLYDRVITMCPDNAVCRSNRAAALTGLQRFGEAVTECEEALRLDPAFGRAHQRLASLLLRLGQVENARKHLFLAGPKPDPLELQKLQEVEKHLERSANARNVGDWKSMLSETNAAIAHGADSSSLLMASKAEAHLRLHQLQDAELALSNASKLDSSSSPHSSAKFFGMVSNSYMYVVRAQVELARGRFEDSVAAAEKARQIDPSNIEVSMLLNDIRIVSRSRASGNEFFNSGKFLEACLAYEEGLNHAPISNAILHSNRAACMSKLGQWEKSIEDCNEALRIQPNYTKALLRRAASFAELEQWNQAEKDYEVLRKEMPGDTEVVEALSRVQIAIRASRVKDVSDLKFSMEIKEIRGPEHFQAAITSPGVSVIHFTTAMNPNCDKITPFINTMCARYPSVKFLKVDMNTIPTLAKTENVRAVPTLKIYKNGAKVKEIINPNQQVLEYTLKHYT
ncbi:inactive TPR repeat-containing thioredoxin TTL3-like [Zingiber officinale]|uniref:Thioredoxin domain-containing protein n=1 Tax=Zingiber officinale TaxID=94328 RepID=A0A8J5GCC7_ZINOF|nr:inactive TPR repeat-containing thioredoxin TTL3-like [Zingiber officinale]KAG6496922.1 hypothetical protein ZIOFF_044801 [Zingiber officinale]